MRDVFDDIRLACRAVAEQASHVTIDHERLVAYADSLRVDETDTIENDPGRTARGDDEATASFVISLDAINFGSGYFPSLRKRDGMSGYFTIATSLRDHVDATGPLTAARLRAITTDECCELFGQSDANELARELMALYANALHDLGALLELDFDGSFTRMVRAAGGSAANPVAVLARMPFFRDVSTYRGQAVPLYKRAQITANDLAAAFGHEDLGRFGDLHRLTMFPDNLVPHVLRVDGVLVFEPELVERIERVENIDAGSEPEVEIRAVGLHAVELLVHQLRRRGQDVTAAQLDGLLWRRGGGARYKAVLRHRTRSVFY
jgi:hypothetical protein